MTRLIAGLLIALSLGGCAQLQAVLQATSTIQAGANAVTPNMLYDVENAAIVAFAGLNAYKKSCVQKVIPQTCRAVIKNIQLYTRNVPPLLTSLRAFVRRGDQPSAVSTYNTLAQLITNIKVIAASNNVPMG